jgi:uncharacterized protein
MTEDGALGPTFVGRVASVHGCAVSVRLLGLPSTLVLVDGQSYRVGQLGAFMRIPLGYTSLYGVCTQVGANAAPPLPPEAIPAPTQEEQVAPESYRWLTIALFGEALGGAFDRGVGQYPTVGDEVHLVTPTDLELIYAGRGDRDSIVVGQIASSAGLPARLQLSTLVSRHCSVVGSTGSGKSNLVAIVLEALASPELPSSRTLIIDAHGEYANAVGERGHVIHTGADVPPNEQSLRVPFWALPFEELLALTMGAMQPHAAEALRDKVAEMKKQAASLLADPPPAETITADTPVPFSIEQFWWELEDQQRATYERASPQDPTTKCKPIDPGDPARLRPPEYPPAALGSAAPYLNKARLPITKQVDLLHSRLSDSRFEFMFDRSHSLHPDLEGRVEADLDSLLVGWIGGEKQVTVLDVSGLPPEVMGTVVGTMLRLIYDALFWAMELPVGGRKQPLLIVLEEAHRFLPAEGDTSAHRVVSRIAKEGRKYGVGLIVVTQRPSDIDSGVLSQCGTMIALRVTNGSDRGAVAGMVPDDLGGLVALLPSLRTGEALVLGDALQVPSRIRVRKATRKPIGDDPPLPSAWQQSKRPDPALYADAIKNWRQQSTSAATASNAATQTKRTSRTRGRQRATRKAEPVRQAKAKPRSNKSNQAEKGDSDG